MYLQRSVMITVNVRLSCGERPKGDAERMSEEVTLDHHTAWPEVRRNFRACQERGPVGSGVLWGGLWDGGGGMGDRGGLKGVGRAVRILKGARHHLQSSAAESACFETLSKKTNARFNARTLKAEPGSLRKDPDLPQLQFTPWILPSPIHFLPFVRLHLLLAFGSEYASTP